MQASPADNRRLRPNGNHFAIPRLSKGFVQDGRKIDPVLGRPVPLVGAVGVTMEEVNQRAQVNCSTSVCFKPTFPGILGARPKTDSNFEREARQLCPASRLRVAALCVEFSVPTSGHESEFNHNGNRVNCLSPAKIRLPRRPATAISVHAGCRHSAARIVSGKPAPRG